jgi:hypothetical protein
MYISDEMGRDKDVTKDVSAFMAYKRSGTGQGFMFGAIVN